MAIVLKKQKTAEGMQMITSSRQMELKRTSSLEAPTMVLRGHQSEVLCGKFNPLGTFLATAGHDKDIYLWSYPSCDNSSLLRGHKNAVLDMAWAQNGKTLYTVGADKSMLVWDPEAGQIVRKYRTVINAHLQCCAATTEEGEQELVATGADDGVVCVHDPRIRRPVHRFNTKYPVTAVSFGFGGTLFSSGIERSITGWDLRRGEVAMTLTGHQDAVTGLAVNSNGKHLASNSMDNSVRIWDVRSFASGDRCIKVMLGHSHGMEKNMIRVAWSKDDKMVASGSSDRQCYVWNVASRRIMYCLPGHGGCVNEVSFHPEEPVIASMSSDKKVFMGELAGQQ